MPINPIIKVFLAGEGGVGKTTMVDRYVKGFFNPNTIMTIGVNHAVKDMISDTGKSYTLQIWDLGGEDRFKFILPMYVRGAQAGMLVYDTTRFSTFKHLDVWLNLIRSVIPDVPIVLVGTKTDVPDAIVDPATYDDFVKANNLAGLFLTSSKDGTNVERAFEHLVKLYEEKTTKIK
jgi:small GTP-binding protein